MGRITRLKVTTLLDSFIKYKSQHTNDVKLVMAGPFEDKKEQFPHNNDIIYTGFITDQEKMPLIKGSLMMVNASLMESLSLLMLEGMAMGKVVLVNGGCSVLKDHCINSGCKKMYYNSKNFIDRLSLFIDDKALRDQYGQKGKAYFERNYNWGAVLERLHKVIDTVKKRQSLASAL